MRQDFVESRARAVSCDTALRAVGSLCADDRSASRDECVPRQQAEIGEPMREIEVTPLEEPVPDFAPVRAPEEAPAEPVRQPVRVPA